MALSINNNLMATMAANNLSRSYNSLSKSVKALSSGLRISGAADDAAGLAVREILRSDIAVLNQGVRNANDAISMLQTMDGAAGVIDEKLIRMKELAEQASTGTYSEEQRAIMNDEFAAMRNEIDRIAKATDFNGTKMLDGAGDAVAQVLGQAGDAADISAFDSATNFSSVFSTYAAGDILTLDYAGHDSSASAGQVSMTIASGTTISDVMGWINSGTSTAQTLTVEADSSSAATTSALVSAFTDFASGETFVFGYTKNDGTEAISAFGEISSSDTTVQSILDFINDGSATFGFTAEWSSADTAIVLTDTTTGASKAEAWFLADGDRYSFEIDTAGQDSTANVGLTASWSSASGEGFLLTDETSGVSLAEAQFVGGGGPYEFTVNTEGSDGGEDVKIHFGTGNSSAEDYYYLEKQDMTAEGLGIDELSIATQHSAQTALETLDAAIISKDEGRAHFGAMINRLENTVTNLTIQSENIQAAESQISDVDVAFEMTNFMNTQIKAQAAVAMLSQANMLPQMAMSLLGG
jgi:flagellin